MRFLETITGWGDDLLIPIDRIQYISFKFVKSWEITIISDDGGNVVEFFENEDHATKRYEKIKSIINSSDTPTLVNKKQSRKNKENKK